MPRPKMAEMAYLYKQATQEWEFEAVHRLNCQTFCVEIPQHARPQDGRLVDRFHSQNTYLICLHGQELAGMLCMRNQRPFSLDEKLPQLDSLLPPFTHAAEARLLAVAQGHRRGRILQGLLEMAGQWCMRQGCDILLISGYLKQQKLYSKLGLVPFGPVTGSGEALFQPMYLRWSTYRWKNPPIGKNSSHHPI